MTADILQQCETTLFALKFSKDNGNRHSILTSFSYDIFDEIVYEVGAELSFLGSGEIDDKSSLITDFQEVDEDGFAEIWRQLGEVERVALSYGTEESVTVVFPEVYTDWLAFSQDEALVSVAEGLRAKANTLTLDVQEIRNEYVEPLMVRKAAEDETLRNQDVFGPFPLMRSVNGDSSESDKPYEYDLRTVCEKIETLLGGKPKYIGPDDFLFYMAWYNTPCDKSVIEKLAGKGHTLSQYALAEIALGDAKTVRDKLSHWRDAIASLDKMFLDADELKEDLLRRISIDLEKYQQTVADTDIRKNLENAVEAELPEAIALSEAISQFETSCPAFADECANAISQLTKKIETIEHEQKKKQEAEEKAEQERLAREKKDQERIRAQENADRIRRERTKEAIRQVSDGSTEESEFAPAEGVTTLVVAAREHNAEAMVWLGKCLLWGTGTAIDVPHGLEMVKRGVAKGCSYGNAVLGEAHLFGIPPSLPRNHYEAVRLFRMSPKDPHCMVGLARCYYEGWGVPKSVENAFNLYKKSGLAEGIHYATYISTTIPRLKGDLYIGEAEMNGYKRAATMGCVLSMVNYADLFLLKKKKVEAEEWYRKALEIHHAEAQKLACKRLRKMGLTAYMPPIHNEIVTLRWDDEGWPWDDTSAMSAE